MMNSGLTFCLTVTAFDFHAEDGKSKVVIPSNMITSLNAAPPIVTDLAVGPVGPRGTLIHLLSGDCVQVIESLDEVLKRLEVCCSWYVVPYPPPDPFDDLEKQLDKPKPRRKTKGDKA